jgi:hypothetical protein
MIQLFGDPYNIQGNNQNLQGGYNPQQAINPQQPPASPVSPQAQKPVARKAAAPRPAPTAQPIQINSAYSPYVQTRPSPSTPGVLEYYNPQNGVGFSNPNDIFNYLRTTTGQSLTDLSQLSAPQYAQPQTQQTQQPDPYESFAQSAAQAGLGVEEYLKYITGGVSADERNKINSGLGIPEAYKQLFTPAPATKDLYNNAYSQAGLGDLKARIKEKLAEVNRIQSLYTEKGGKINENPFLSEASRVGRLRVLDDKRLQEIGNLNNELQSMEDLYNNGVNEVNSLVSMSAQDFSNSQRTNALKLTYLQQQAEQQLADLQNTKNKEAYKYLPDYLKAKAAATKPDTIGSNETGFYRWNPATSTFEQVVAPRVIPNFSVNPITGEYYNTKTGLTQGGTVPTVSGKPATDAQNQSAGYATRIQQASKIIDELEKSIASYNPVSFAAELKLPSWAQSPQIQQYQQAALNLIGAKLRKESGAAISQTEYDNAYAQYLPKAGDSPEVLAQKKQNRDTILQGEIQNAGPAYGGSGGYTNDPLGLFSSAGNASASTGMRTDRHNNPTAFTTTIAKQAGLVLGQDYEVGDPFPNNPNIYTARLIGDPISQTIKVIDRIGFTTHSGQPRWTYTNSIPQTKNWSNLSYDQKKQVVAQMYQHEGGEALKQYFA